MTSDVYSYKLLDAVIVELENTWCPLQAARLRIDKSALERAAIDVN